MGLYFNKNFSLEAWPNVAICAVDEAGNHVPLTKDECTFLLSCNGEELDSASNEALAQKFLKRGILVEDEALGAEPSIELHEYLYRDAAVIGITGRCNYQCRHCIAAAGTQRERDELTLEEITDLFAQMQQLGIRNAWLTGGEPLVHPKFAQIIEAATKYNIHITRLLTNGSLITAEVLEHMINNKQHPVLGISFDGLGTHDWMRCVEGAEEASLRAIQLGREYGFSVQPHINVNNVTAPRIIETCRVLVNEYGCGNLRIIPTSRSPRWEELAGPDDGISYDDYYALMLEIIRVARKENWPAYLDLRSMPQVHNFEADRAKKFLALLKEPPAVCLNKRSLSACSRTKTQIFIAHDGRVLPCNAYEGTTKQYGFLVGDDINIRKRPLKDILTKSEYVTLFDDRMSNFLHDRPECAECKWVGICNGGCSLFALGNRMHLADENANCSFFKGGWADRYIELMDELLEQEQAN